MVVAGTATSDGAGVTLNRLIGGPTLPGLDPFLLLDAFDSDDSADYIGGFPSHPHRGFETVTYMLAGRMRHEDNQGNGGTLGAGSVQWMTAGRGIVHSEMPEQEEGLMSGFQLWVNLPAADKMCPPRYQNIEPEDIPEIVRDDGVRIRIIAGEVDGTAGAASGIAVELVAAAEPARLLLLAGRPLNEPVERYGPFVMNTREEIVQAIHDFQSGAF